MLAGALLVLPACDLNLRPGAESIFEAFDARRSPPELAAMAIDQYDANNRYIGTLGLATMPFASEPLYIRLFVDNIRDDDPAVRGAAARGLANHGRPEHAPLLVAAMKDQDRGVRVEAARGLQRLHNPAAIDGLLVSMREPLMPRAGRAVLPGESDAEVRAEAAWALGQYPQNRVLQALISGLDDSDLSVNRSALIALRTLTGEDFGYSRGAWLEWLSRTRDPFAGRGEYNYPVFHRRHRLYEYLPFVPEPPNEIAAPPAGMPRE
jgi:HEAT repeat protein